MKLELDKTRIEKSLSFYNRVKKELKADVSLITQMVAIFLMLVVLIVLSNFVSRNIGQRILEQRSQKEKLTISEVEQKIKNQEPVNVRLKVDDFNDSKNYLPIFDNKEVGVKAFGKNQKGTYVPIQVDSLGRVICKCEY